MITPAPVAVLLFTHNEARNIDACLECVAGWVQEIHVVDSGSDDDTVARACRYTDNIYVHPYVDHPSQITWALEHVPFGPEWVLILDADYRVSPELRRQIVEATAAADPAISGYYTEHRVLFRGMPVRGFKERAMRLIRRSDVVIEPSELVDARLLVSGPTGYLSGTMVEDNEREYDIDFWIDKHQRYAKRQAIEEVLRVRGMVDWSTRPRLLGSHDERIMWIKDRWYRLPLFLRPFVYFFYRYIARLGFLDGRNGLAFHFMQALWFRLLVDIHREDLERLIRTGQVTATELYEQGGYARRNDLGRGPQPSSTTPARMTSEAAGARG